MALVVIEMGRRVVTPLKNQHLRTVKTQASKATPAIDSYHSLTPEETASHYYSQQNTSQHSEHTPSKVSLLSEIMTKPVISLDIDSSTANAWQLFQHHGFHHLPIVDENNTTLAMLSDRNIMQSPGSSKNINQEKSINFASATVFCFTPDTDIRQATRILYEYDLGALPVVNEHYQLLGIVTRSDIMKLVSAYGPLELWA